MSWTCFGGLVMFFNSVGGDLILSHRFAGVRNLAVSGKGTVCVR